MGIFISKKNMLRCPVCGGIYEISDGYTNCFKCGCKLITQDEYSSSGYHADQPTVECPYCHSINTSKISTTAKVVNTAIFGIFGTKRHKQWHCNDCNSDF